MLAHPAAAVNPSTPICPGGLHDGLREEFGCVVRHPAAHAVLFLRGDRTVFCETLHPHEDWFVGLAEVGDLGRPVVHLKIDVEVIVVVPGSLDVWVPKALQVGRVAVGAGTGDQQVTSVVEDQCVQAWVTVLFSQAGETLIRGEPGELRRW